MLARNDVLSILLVNYHRARLGLVWLTRLKWTSLLIDAFPYIDNALETILVTSEESLSKPLRLHTL